MSKKYICPNCNTLIIADTNEKISECLICGFSIKKPKMNKTLTIILTISIILLLAIIIHLLFGGVFGLDI